LTTLINSHFLLLGYRLLFLGLFSLIVHLLTGDFAFSEEGSGFLLLIELPLVDLLELIYLRSEGLAECGLSSGYKRFLDFDAAESHSLIAFRVVDGLGAKNFGEIEEVALNEIHCIHAPLIIITFL
jgi:hypothetical protein